MDQVVLTKDKKALARILDDHAERCESQYMYRRTQWLLAWYYLNGYRRFDVFNPETGQLTPHILDEEGKMEFVSQEMLYHINQVSGRIQSMDLRPKVEQQGFTLGGMRSKAVTQILDDSVFSEEQIKRAGEEWAYLFTCLGFAGITGHLVQHNTIGLTADLEVVHPKELFPFPLVTEDHTKAKGLMRQRWVPVSFLKNLYGKKIVTNMEDLDWYEVEAGEAWSQDETEDITWWGKNSRGGASPLEGGGEKEFIAVAKVRELWLNGSRGTVDRYIVASGEYVMDDQDLKDAEVYCPIGWARFMNNGSFHGAGMFDLLFSQHRNFEKLSKNLYNNILELDKFGVVVLPQGQMNKNDLLRDVGNGLRAIFLEPDPVSEGFKPLVIQPFSAGDVPGRTAQFAREGMKAVNPIQDLIQEKGRVDSASGLQFLDEQISKALTSPSSGVQKAWGEMYRSTTQRAVAQLTLSPQTIPVGSLTLDMAGAVIDPETNAISFNANPIPDISRLKFTIRDVSPRSLVARKTEAVELWKLGINQDPAAFRMFAIKEGLDFAMWMDEDIGAYEMGTRTILTLFNDGESPGQIIITPHTTRPEIVLRQLTAFMTGPAMQKASVEVIDAFRILRQTLLGFMGMVLPAAMPNPDDLAMLQMGGGGAMLPPGGSGLPGPPQQGTPGSSQGTPQGNRR